LNKIICTKMTEKEIIEKYDKLLQQFLDNNLSKRDKTIEGDTKQYREIINQLNKLYNFMHFVYDEYLLKEPHSVYKAVMYDFVLKAGQTTYAIYLCLDKFLERDAAVLCRSLFELHLTVSLILEKDVEDRIALYMNFFPILKYKEFDRGKLKIEDETEKKLLIENYNKFKDDYKAKNPNSWCYKILKDEIENPKKDPNLFDIASYLDKIHPDYDNLFTKLYNNTYSAFSMAIHSSVGSSNLLNISDAVGCFSISHSSQILKNVLGHYKVKDYEELIKYIDLLYNVCLENLNKGRKK